MSDPKLAEEIARAVGDHGAGTVKLAGYIRDNFALITEHKKHATWAQVAAAIYARGVSDANGGEPSGPTVKEAYIRVARKLTKEAAHKPARVGRPPQSPVAPVVHSSKRFPQE